MTNKEQAPIDRAMELLFKAQDHGIESLTPEEREEMIQIMTEMLKVFTEAMQPIIEDLVKAVTPVIEAMTEWMNNLSDEDREVLETMLKASQKNDISLPTSGGRADLGAVNAAIRKEIHDKGIPLPQTNVISGIPPMSDYGPATSYPNFPERMRS